MGAGCDCNGGTYACGICIEEGLISIPLDTDSPFKLARATPNKAACISALPAEREGTC